MIPAHGPGPHQVLDVVVIDRHVAIDQVGHQRAPAIQAVVDGIGNGAAVGYAPAFQLQPDVHFLIQWFGPGLSHVESLLDR
jgi:hypothetical protein